MSKKNKKHSTMAKLLMITLVMVAMVVLLLGVRVFFTKRWGFPNTHVDGNEALTSRSELPEH